MSDILTITNFAQQSDYQAGGFNTVMGGYNYPDYGIVGGSQNMLPAEHNGKQIYREGSTIHGIWKSFSVELGAAVGVTAFNGRCDRRISFDADGNCYTLVQVGSTSTPTHYLCHSDDYGQTWTKYALPGTRRYARIEFNDHPTRRPGYPPAVLLFNGSTETPANRLELVLPTISGGVVTVGSAYTVSSSQSLLEAQHSGAGNSVITWGDRVLVAWPSNVDGGGGTSQYVTTFDRSDGTLLETSLVGESDSDDPDAHDAPAITVDSQDTFHVILGQHHGDLKHVTSGADGDYTTWNSPTTIDAAVAGAGHTYMAIVCDSTDRLHVVTRDASENTYHFKLNYFRRSAAGSWAKVHTLINPSRNYYTNYYHALSILEDDELWVTGPGLLFGQILESSERAVYNAAFPNEIIATYRIATGGISGGPFEYGELITGSNSQSTGRYRYAVGSTIYYTPVSAEELESAETLTGGTSGATATTSAGPVSMQEGLYYNLQYHQTCHWPYALFSNDGGDTWQASTLTFDNAGVLFGDVECGEFIEFGDVECSPIIAFDLEALPA